MTRFVHFLIAKAAQDLASSPLGHPQQGCPHSPPRPRSVSEKGSPKGQLEAPFFNGMGKMGLGRSEAPLKPGFNSWGRTVPVESLSHLPPCSLGLLARLGQVLRRFSKLKNVRTGILFLAAICFFSDIVFACPMCRELLEHGKDAIAALRFGKGIAYSMILLFSMPLLLVGGTAFFLVRHQKNLRTK